MILADLKPGQPVRFNHCGAARTGQVYEIAAYGIGEGLITVAFFSSLHRSWVTKTFRPDQLEPAPEDG